MLSFQVVLALIILLATMATAVVGIVMRSQKKLPDPKPASGIVWLLAGVAVFLLLVIVLAFLGIAGGT